MYIHEKIKSFIKNMNLLWDADIKEVKLCTLIKLANGLDISINELIQIYTKE